MVEADPFSTTIDADAGHLRDLRKRIAGWLQRAGIEEDLRDEVVLATHEAAASAIERSATRVDVQAAIERRTIIVVVEADAEWRALEADDRGSRMDVIHNLVSRARFKPEPGKVRLELEKRL